jgi:glutaredoxin-related protein
LNFYSIDAEELEDLSIRFDIESVPTFIVLKGDQEVERYQGQNAPQVTQLIQKYSNLKTEQPQPLPVKKQSLETLVNSHPIMIFIKGTPSQPRCGFSRQAIDLLNDLNVAYGSFDILADEDVRQGLKEFSDWPTFPQSINA